MIDELKLASDQLRAAWDRYYRICSNLENHLTKAKPLGACGSASEVSQLLDTEAELVSSYEPRIQEIKFAIRRARNYLSGIAPINTLPPETLARIFQLVLVQPCNLHRLSSSNNTDYPRFPDYLTHVCSRWRRIAISTRSLWCHIDLSPHGSYITGLGARARAYVVRSGELPLELHVAGDAGGDRSVKYHEDHDLFLFVSDISPRVDALEFVAEEFGDFHRGVLCELLLRQPSTLTKLVIQSENEHYNDFIASGSFDLTELDGTRGELDLALTADQLESGFAPLKILHLRGIFPLWSSTAYHGLVDLRLLSSPTWSNITEAEIITILESCPGLRVLHFELEILNSRSETEQVM